MKDKKWRRKWNLYEGSTCVAQGVLYREMNVQILWRSDIGWTGQQLSSLQGLFELWPDATWLNVRPAEEKEDLQ